MTVFRLSGFFFQAVLLICWCGCGYCSDLPDLLMVGKIRALSAEMSEKRLILKTSHQQTSLQPNCGNRLEDVLSCHQLTQVELSGGRLTLVPDINNQWLKTPVDFTLVEPDSQWVEALTIPLLSYIKSILWLNEQTLGWLARAVKQAISHVRSLSGNLYPLFSSEGSGYRDHQPLLSEPPPFPAPRVSVVVNEQGIQYDLRFGTNVTTIQELSESGGYSLTYQLIPEQVEPLLVAGAGGDGDGFNRTDSPLPKDKVPDENSVNQPWIYLSGSAAYHLQRLKQVQHKLEKARKLGHRDLALILQDRATLMALELDHHIQKSLISTPDTSAQETGSTASQRSQDEQHAAYMFVSHSINGVVKLLPVNRGERDDDPGDESALHTLDRQCPLCGGGLCREVPPAVKDWLMQIECRLSDDTLPVAETIHHPTQCENVQTLDMAQACTLMGHDLWHSNLKHFYQIRINSVFPHQELEKLEIKETPELYALIREKKISLLDALPMELSIMIIRMLDIKSFLNLWLAHRLTRERNHALDLAVLLTRRFLRHQSIASEGLCPASILQFGNSHPWLPQNIICRNGLMCDVLAFCQNFPVRRAAMLNLLVQKHFLKTVLRSRVMLDKYFDTNNEPLLLELAGMNLALWQNDLLILFQLKTAGMLPLNCMRIKGCYKLLLTQNKKLICVTREKLIHCFFVGLDGNQTDLWVAEARINDALVLSNGQLLVSETSGRVSFLDIQQDEPFSVTVARSIPSSYNRRNIRWAEFSDGTLVAFLNRVFMAIYETSDYLAFNQDTPTRLINPFHHVFYQSDKVYQGFLKLSSSSCSEPPVVLPDRKLAVMSEYDGLAIVKDALETPKSGDELWWCKDRCDKKSKCLSCTPDRTLIFCHNELKPSCRAKLHWMPLNGECQQLIEMKDKTITGLLGLSNGYIVCCSTEGNQNIVEVYDPYAFPARR